MRAVTAIGGNLSRYFRAQLLPRRGPRLGRAALRRLVLPFVLFFAVALAMMSPLAYSEMPESQGQDLANHVAGIVEAKNALGEGQFPIRVAPRQNDGTRYPLFQYYGHLPYLPGGLLHRLTHVSPY